MQKATGKPLPVVADFTLLRQHAFMCWLRDRKPRPSGTKTISTYMAMIKAAMNFASTPRLIFDSKGVEREGVLMDRQWKVFDSEEYVSKVTSLPMPEPVSFFPSDAEMARFIEEINHEHIFRYVIIALNTWARPEAIMELDVEEQVDFNHGLIYLNQKGRRQSKKVRPAIRLTENLKGWFLHWGLSKPIVRNGLIVNEVNPKTRSAFERVFLNSPDTHSGAGGAQESADCRRTCGRRAKSAQRGWGTPTQTTERPKNIMNFSIPAI
jgi:hypothetical protein